MIFLSSSSCLSVHTHTHNLSVSSRPGTHTPPDWWETDVLISNQTITTALKNNNQPDSKSIYMMLTDKTVYSVENVHFISIPTPYFLLIYRRLKKSHAFRLQDWGILLDICRHWNIFLLGIWINRTLLNSTISKWTLTGHTSNKARIARSDTARLLNKA